LLARYFVPARVDRIDDVLGAVAENGPIGHPIRLMFRGVKSVLRIVQPSDGDGEQKSDDNTENKTHEIASLKDILSNEDGSVGSLTGSSDAFIECFGTARNPVHIKNSTWE
jgi:hypothetical protein